MYHTYTSCGTFTVRAWVWDKGNFAQDISPGSPRLLAEKQIEVSSDCTPPNINLVKPACDGEFVGGMGNQATMLSEDGQGPYDCNLVFVKAYVSDDLSGVKWVRLYVDGQPKGDFLQESGYWRFNWDISGTGTGEHTLEVRACDNSPCENQSSVFRQVWVRPQVDADKAKWTNDHDLWDRSDDVSIAGTWEWDPPAATKPIAFTISTVMQGSVRIIPVQPEQINYAVKLRLVVQNVWSDQTSERTIDNTDVAALPALADCKPHSRDKVRPPYVLTQTYQFYIKKCADSDWACAGTHVIEWPTVYLTFNAPVAPWGTKYNAQGQPVATRTCWVEALHRASTNMPDGGYTSQQEAQARQKMVDAIYYSGKTYNHTAISHYRYNQGSGRRRFSLWDFLPRDQGDCQDFSLYWQKLCHAIGLDTKARRIDGEGQPPTIPPARAGFTTKDVLPANTTTWRSFSFAFHHVGWSDGVFDPCAKLNQPNPLLAKGISTGTYQGYLLDHVNPGYWVLVWDEQQQQWVAVWVAEGTFDWINQWRLGETDPFFQQQTEVD